MGARRFYVVREVVLPTGEFAKFAEDFSRPKNS